MAPCKRRWVRAGQEDGPRMNPEVGDINYPPDHLTCNPSASWITTSGSSTLFQFWSKFDYVMF